LPRTGLPDVLTSFGEYRRLVDQLVSAGCIEDATKIWWDIRPSAKFPTLEQRVTDVCSRVEDAACVAAMFQSLMAFLFRLRTRNQRWRLYPATLIRENRWRAQRYGLDEGLVDFGLGKIVPCATPLGEIFDLVEEDADALDCVNEIGHLKTILKKGTSAHRQLATYAKALDNGAGRHDALVGVVEDESAK